MIDNNPLKQYFRRPAIYIRLPSEGKYYAPGIVSQTETGELPVYPMTGVDEITIRTVDGLFNGQAVADVISSCIPDIKQPWLLNNIDLEAVIIAIRAASVDGKLEIQSTCPSCAEISTYDVDLMKLLADKTNIDYSKPLKIRDLELKFRPLTYQEVNQNNMAQYQVQKTIRMLQDVKDDEQSQVMVKKAFADMSSMMNDVITQSIESIKTPETTVTDKAYIRDFLDNCDSKTATAIKDYGIEMRQKNDNKPLQLKCTACEHEYKQQLALNFTDFFD